MALPNTVVGLIEELETAYPPRCRKTTESELEHERYAGASDLVRRLRERLEADAADHPKVL